MEKESPYFYIEHEYTINTIGDLIELNRPKIYSDLGIEFKPSYPLNPESLDRRIFSEYETCGLFRGQACNWPLIPTSYREIKQTKVSETSEFSRKIAYMSSNSEIATFCKHASKQNYSFPKSTIEQISIGQHYGIKTPLLDWSTNVIVAAYFAIAIKGNEDTPEFLEPCIYHLRDERHLKSINDESIDIAEINYSALVRPFLLDRRIDRQFSVFSFHPHPVHEPTKIPIDKHLISLDFFFDLWKILQGLGYSSSHFFPDYAGLAERIKHDYSI